MIDARIAELQQEVVRWYWWAVTRGEYDRLDDRPDAKVRLESFMDLLEVKLPPAEWVPLLHPGYIIRDPDGWRGSDAPSWETPLTRQDFESRWARCTIGMVR